MAKYLGLKSALELEGRVVRTKHDMENGLTTIPKGSLAVITGWVRDGHISITCYSCPCCNVAPKLSRLSYTDLELVD